MDIKMTKLSSLSFCPFLTDSYVLLFFLAVYQSWCHTSFTRSADRKQFPPLSPRGCEWPNHAHHWKQMLLLAHKIGPILLSLRRKKKKTLSETLQWFMFFIFLYHFINLKERSAELNRTMTKQNLTNLLGFSVILIPQKIEYANAMKFIFSFN